MKRLFAFAMLLVMFLNFAGFYVYFFVQLSNIKREMREALRSKPVDELVVLRLSPEEYKQAYVEEHEVKVDGKMFDVARQFHHGDEVILYGLYDDDETSLIGWLDKLSGQPFHSKIPLPEQVLQFIGLTFLPSFFEPGYKSFTNSISETPYFEMTSSFSLPVKVPPPRLQTPFAFSF